MKVEFGEWLPDLASFNNPGSTEAKNVLPGANSYLPFNHALDYSLNAIENICQGAGSGKDRLGNAYNYAGDREKLYVLEGGSLINISRENGYNTSEDDFWSFAQFGNQMIATNYSDEMQVADLSANAKFDDLGGEPPKARSIATVGDFVVALNTFDLDGSVPYRVRWSAIGNPESWTVSSITQADYQDLDSSSGWGQQIVGGEYGVILMDNAIYRMDYVGSPGIFRFYQVERGRGTPAPKSAIRIGNFVAYLGQDGFYLFDGQSSIPIGANKVDKYFYSNVDAAYLSRVVASVDTERQLIFWVYPGTGSVGGTPNCALVYNYSPNATKKWSRIEGIDVDYIYSGLTRGYLMNELDAINIELNKILHSLDSRIWMGGSFFLGGFDSRKKLVSFDGEPMDATIDTLEAQPNEGGLSEVHVVRPLVDSPDADIMVQVGSRNKTGEEVNWGEEVEVNETGEAPVRAHARYHRFRVNIRGDFDHAQGIDIVQIRKAGRR